MDDEACEDVCYSMTINVRRSQLLALLGIGKFVAIFVLWVAAVVYAADVFPAESSDWQQHPTG